MTLQPDVNLHICLNGKTITKEQNSKGMMKFFLLGYTSTGTCSNSISICDCVGTGKFAYTAGQAHTDHSSFIQNYTKSGATNQTRVDFYGGTVGQATIKIDTTSGGAITVSANTVLNIYGGTINGALCYTADGTKVNNNGAAIRIAGGTVNMYGGTICNGKANNGGSIYLEGGTFNMHGGTISGSSALNNGGSIFANSKDATINMYPGAVIEGGSAVNGGNIHLVGAVLNMNGGEISGGTATDRGGNISLTFSEVSAEANLKGGKVSGGTAKNAGGNVAAAGNGAKITISGATVTGGTINPDATTASYTNSSTYVNAYAGYGGNIYLQGNSTLTMTDGEVSNGTINVTGTGLGLGGNIALIAWKNSDKQLAGTITISGGVVKNGKITSSSSKENGNTVLGGANIAVGGATSTGMDQKGTLNLTAGQLLIESDEYGLFYTGTATKAYAKGGNLYVSPGSTANINAAAGKSILISGGYTNTKNWAAGGNIYNAGTLKMTGDVTVSGGHGTTQLDGGNLYGPATVTGAKFLNGNSKTGGGICLESGTSTFTSCEFEGNVATSQGGAVYLKGNPTVTFTDCTFTENRAGTYGGALGAA